MNEAYKALGVSENVLAFSETILSDLKDRFAAIDTIAEANQLKVIAAMQKNRVAANHLTFPPATATTTRDATRWSASTPTASARRPPWFARRSPVVPTRWRWRWARTCCRGTNF